MTTTRNTLLTSFTLLMLSMHVAHADVLVINGIAPFDTNLGTLTHAVVSLDPTPTQTSSYDTNFSSISSHAHTVLVPPVNIAGFDTFSFAPLQTSHASSGVFSSHHHTVNPLPSVKNYSGAGLSWFLNAANSAVNSVFLPVINTSENENHTHTVNFPPVVPRTTYTYTPAVIPEPSTLGLIALGSIAILFQRRRPA